MGLLRIDFLAAGGGGWDVCEGDDGTGRREDGLGG